MIVSDMRNHCINHGNNKYKNKGSSLLDEPNGSWAPIGADGDFFEIIMEGGVSRLRHYVHRTV